MHLVGFTIEMYYDARPYECQISMYLLFVTHIPEDDHRSGRNM